MMCLLLSRGLSRMTVNSERQRTYTFVESVALWHGND